MSSFASQAWEPGRIIITRRSGRRIYTLRNAKLGMRVVVKEFADPALGAREAAMMRACEGDPRLVRLLDFYEHDGKGYLVMEYIAGDTLTRIVNAGGPFPRRAAVVLAVEMLRGLAAIHRREIVHGDFQARNVMLCATGRPLVKIIDFQHAVPLDASGKAEALRRLPKPPPALAPETATGLIDVRYDVYGAGMILAYLVTGRHARPRRTARRRARAADPLWRLIFKATAADPQERFSSAEEFCEALIGLLVKNRL